MRWLLIAVAVLVSAPAAMTDVPADFARANETFERSVALLGKNDREAAAGLRHSAELFEAIVNEQGVTSSDVLTNAGNARLLAGDIGEAIALYHRALRVDPADENARANLSVARTRASADAAIEDSGSVVEALTGWRRGLSGTTRTTIAATAWGLLWTWAALRAMRVRAGRWPAVALPCAAVAVVMALTLAADAAVTSGPGVGVVVSSGAVGRTGPDAVVYDPSFTKPLPEGVEFRVVDRRAGWVLGRLADGRETWLPERDVALVGV